MTRTRKWGVWPVAALLLATVAGTALAAPSVPGEVYSDSQAQGVNKPVDRIAADLRNSGIKDVSPTDWYAGSITVVVQAGLLKPEPDGTIHPDAPLTASEGVAVFAKVLGIAGKTDDPATALQKAEQAGLVDPGVQPDRDMTRLEVARLLARALGVQPKLIVTPAQYPFNDMFAVSNAEDQGILAALYDLGIFKGFEDRTFRPDNVLTKAQIALLIDRILGAKGL